MFTASQETTDRKLAAQEVIFENRIQQLEKSISENATAIRTKSHVKQVRPHLFKTVAISLVANFKYRSDRQNPTTTIGNLFKDKPELKNAERLTKRYYKAQTEPSSTGNSTDVVTMAALGDFYREIENVSIFGALGASYANALNFAGASELIVPRRKSQGGLAASFVAEGASIPVKADDYIAAIIKRYKVAVIAVFTKDLERVSNPELVNLIENSMKVDTAEAIDAAFFSADPGVADIRPEGILTDRTTQATAGNDIDSITADFGWLMGEALAMRAKRPVLVLNPLTLMKLSMKTTATGSYVYRDEINNGTLFTIPFISSQNAPVSEVTILDADAVYLGADVPDLQLSDSATIVMADDDGTPPTMADTNAVNDEGGSIHISDAAGTVPASKVMSTFQTWSTALRMVMPVTWGKLKPTIAATITGVNY